MLVFFVVLAWGFRSDSLLEKLGRLLEDWVRIFELRGMILEHLNDIFEEMAIILELGTFIRTFHRILELLRNILENHT